MTDQPSTVPPSGAAVEKTARISDCGLYRYALTRRWGDAPSLRFVMLNPSTADASLDDPTIRRCIGFAKREGYGGLVVLNLYAYRATNPKALLTCADAVGPGNDDMLRSHLRSSVGVARPVVAAWGANARLDRVGLVLNLVPGVDWRCLGTTKQGAPKHPLYVRGDQPLVPYPWAALASAPRTSAAPSTAGGTSCTPTAAAPAGDCGHILELPIAVLREHPANVRTDLGDPIELEQLARSIRQQGILQPLVVMHREHTYVLLAGHRRLAAATQAGLTRVPVVIHPARDDHASIETMLVENLQRANLHPLDEAAAYRQLLDTGRTMSDIARAVGKHQGHISQRVALLNLTHAEQAAMRRGDIGIVDAYLTGRDRSQRRMTGPQRRPKPKSVPHFTKAHPLAHLAALACDHDTLLKLGPACGPCWETVIRTDQAARTLPQLVEPDSGPDHPIGADALVSDVDVDDPDVIRRHKAMAEEGTA